MHLFSTAGNIHILRALLHYVDIIDRKLGHLLFHHAAHALRQLYAACAAFWAKGMTRIPGPDPISRTRVFSLISVSQMVWSMRLPSFRHMFQGWGSLSRLSQMRAQSQPFLIHLSQEDQWNLQTQLIHSPRDE